MKYIKSTALKTENTPTPPLWRDANWTKGREGKWRRLWGTKTWLLSLKLLYFPPVAHTVIRTHSLIHRQTTVTHTHSPSCLFLAVYWAIFRPLPVSSHLAGRDHSQHKGTGLTLRAYVSVRVCVCSSVCVTLLKTSSVSNLKQHS